MLSQLVKCLEGSPAVQLAHAAGLLVMLAQAVAEPNANWSDRSASASNACHHQTSIPFCMLCVVHKHAAALATQGPGGETITEDRLL